MAKYLISACLAGIPCRYNGSACPHPAAKALVEKGEGLPFCPETAGGLPVPRPPCEIRRLHGTERVISHTGADCTDAYQKGAEAALLFMREHGLTCAILKSRSPSCGKDRIYDGSFSGRLVPGHGFTARLLLKKGMEVLTEEELENLPLTNA